VNPLSAEVHGASEIPTGVNPPAETGSRLDNLDVKPRVMQRSRGAQPRHARTDNDYGPSARCRTGGPQCCCRGQGESRSNEFPAIHGRNSFIVEDKFWGFELRAASNESPPGAPIL
jgi:hypothetical protein